MAAGLKKSIVLRKFFRISGVELKGIIMKIASREEQQKIRRRASEDLTVIDQKTDQPLGQVLDMSIKGLKLTSENPIAVRRIYYCRMPLKRKIDGFGEIFFDAECRWCVESDDIGWYNSGFLLRFSSPRDAELVQKLIRSWMATQAHEMNMRHR
jgi:hypothetical protein